MAIGLWLYLVECMHAIITRVRTTALYGCGNVYVSLWVGEDKALHVTVTVSVLQ